MEEGNTIERYFTSATPAALLCLFAADLTANSNQVTESSDHGAFFVSSSLSPYVWFQIFWEA